MNYLNIENLEVSYENNKLKSETKKVLEDFSLDVNKNELLVLLGPSGCGKSTLLSAISGLITPDKGSIIYCDKTFFDNKSGINLPAEKRNVGFVFQSYALWPHMTIYENIELPLKAKKYKRNEIEEKIEYILSVVSMSEHIYKYPSEISGGERQRVALARSLAYEPSLLLLDEPLANLDANLKAELTQEIREIQKKLEITTIYVTHDQHEAFEVADRIVVMKEGKIMQKGTPREIYHNSKNVFVANFVGKNNILVNGKNLFCNSIKKCENRIIAIRPEDIKLENDGENVGIIKKILYKGNHIEYILCFSGQKIIAHSNKEYHYNVGDNIRFNIKKYNLF